MNHSEALEYAEGLRAQMQPFCTRCEIAGSVRRLKPDGIKDIEIVAQPRVELRPNPADLFGGDVETSVLHADWATAAERLIAWIKPGVKKGQPRIPWEPQPFGKYWKGVLLLPGTDLQSGPGVDVFLNYDPRFWGALMLIRTGSADFSESVMVRARMIGYQFLDGKFLAHGREVAVPEEADVFTHLSIEWRDPEFRRDHADIIPIRHNGDEH